MVRLSEAVLARARAQVVRLGLGTKRLRIISVTIVILRIIVSIPPFAQTSETRKCKN